MRIPGWLPLALLLIVSPAHPQDAPADEASIRQLIEVMDADKMLDDMNARIVAHYRKTLSQREVEGMLAFYRSDVGQSVLAKMPVVMQHSMDAMAEHMKPLIPGIQSIVEESLAPLKATRPPS